MYAVLIVLYLFILLYAITFICTIKKYTIPYFVVVLQNNFEIIPYIESEKIYCNICLLFFYILYRKRFVIVSFLWYKGFIWYLYSNLNSIFNYRTPESGSSSHRHQYSSLDVSLTLLSCHYPRKLMKHLKQERKNLWRSVLYQ